MKILKQGAEAILKLDKNILIKERIPKNYRIKQIDELVELYREKIKLCC